MKRKFTQIKAEVMRALLNLNSDSDFLCMLEMEGRFLTKPV